MLRDRINGAFANRAPSACVVLMVALAVLTARVDAWQGERVTDSFSYIAAGADGHAEEDGYSSHAGKIVGPDGRIYDNLATAGEEKGSVPFSNPHVGLFLPAGATCTMLIDAPIAGKYELRFQALCSSANNVLVIKINGQPLRTLPQDGVYGFLPAKPQPYTFIIDVPGDRPSTELTLVGDGSLGMKAFDLKVVLVETDVFGMYETVAQRVRDDVDPIHRWAENLARAEFRQPFREVLADESDQWRKRHKAHAATIESLRGKANSKDAEARLQAVVDDMARSRVELQESAAETLLRSARQELSATPSAATWPETFKGRRAGELLAWAKDYLKAAERWPHETERQRIRRATYATFAWILARKARENIADATAVVRPPAEVWARATPLSPTAGGPIQPLGESPRGSIILNGEWESSPDGGEEHPPAGGWQPMIIPEQSELGFSHIWLRTNFAVPSSWRGRRVLLSLMGAHKFSEYCVNGRFCGSNRGAKVGVEIDLTDAVNWQGDNVLHIFLGNLSYLDVPISQGNLAYGTIVRRQTMGRQVRKGVGIEGDVRLTSRPEICIQDPYVQTDVDEKHIDVSFHVVNGGKTPLRGTVTVRVFDENTPVLDVGSETVSVDAGDSTLVRLSKPWSDPKLWGIGGKYGDPHLYTLSVDLNTKSKRIDRIFQPFGFREFGIEGHRFVLNGEQIMLQGDWWYSGRGYRCNRWAYRAYFKYIRDAHFNMTRPHMQANRPASYFEAADEMGCLVEPEASHAFETTTDLAGLLNYQDPVFNAELKTQIQSIIKLRRNHPSMVFYASENESLWALGSSYYEERKDWYYDVFDSWIRQVAPHVVIDHHGSSLGDLPIDPRSRLANLHYPHTEPDTWRDRFGDRPIIIGEEVYNLGNENYWSKVSQGRDPRQIERDVNEAVEYVRARLGKLKGYYDGTMPVVPEWFNFVFSPERPELMGPYGDIIAARYNMMTHDQRRDWLKETRTWTTLVGALEVPWPALSGSGTKVRLLPYGLDSRFNFFDDTRPLYTPGPIWKVLRDEIFEPMPPICGRKAPAVVVTVTDRGKPVSEVVVFCVPLDGQSVPPIGVRADHAGRALVILPQPGRYRAIAQLATQEPVSTTVETIWGSTDNVVGFADVRAIALEARVTP